MLSNIQIRKNKKYLIVLKGEFLVKRLMGQPISYLRLSRQRS
jgi:hypothetical protein